MQVNLKVLAGPYTGRVFCFTQPDTFLIGRSNDAHLCLTDDKFFSRNHCLLEVTPPHCFLRDLGSTNGTFVNGKRVSEAFLENGAQIQGGETVLLVEVSTGEAGAANKNSLAESTTDYSVKPTIITVACLNCGRREEAQAASAEEDMTFLCEDCRIELKNSPQPIPGYDMVRVLGRGGMGCVMLGRHQATGNHRQRRGYQDAAA
jgi:pSer/pThr/pTyr-binding forkhead associated (FHA) protein